MSFSFAFALDEQGEAGLAPEEPAVQPVAGATACASPSTSGAAAGTGRSWTLDELMDTLPSRISYSALSVPLDAAAPGGSPRAVPIFRRDLFDARFQVLTSSTEHDDDDDDDDVEEGTPRRQGAAAAAAAAQEEQTHVGAASDLLPGVYEGGLKTWECSLDLVAALDSLDRARTEAAGEAWSWLRGCRVLELGCGTAVPSAFLLQRLFSLSDAPPQQQHEARQAEAKATLLHLCDFNAQVLQLVTLPNLLLAWYFSPASLSYRQTSGSAFESADLVASSGDIAVSGALRAAFVASLAQQHIELRFDSGDWSALRLEQGYDVVLSSETIYAPHSLATLCETLQRACRATPAPQEARLCERLRHTSLATGEAFDSPSASAPHALPAASPTTCLVAAKILYFGVGGGVRAFEAELRRRRGWSEVLRETQAGVGRVVLGVGWA